MYLIKIVVFMPLFSYFDRTKMFAHIIHNFLFKGISLIFTHYVLFNIKCITVLEMYTFSIAVILHYL